jgi:hypothetical protein
MDCKKKKWVKPRETATGMIDVPTEIRIERLPNTNQKSYRSINLCNGAVKGTEAMESNEWRMEFGTFCLRTSCIETEGTYERFWWW